MLAMLSITGDITDGTVGGKQAYVSVMLSINNGIGDPDNCPAVQEPPRGVFIYIAINPLMDVQQYQENIRNFEQHGIAVQG